VFDIINARCNHEVQRDIHLCTSIQHNCLISG